MIETKISKSIHTSEWVSFEADSETDALIAARERFAPGWRTVSMLTFKIAPDRLVLFTATNEIAELDPARYGGRAVK